MEDALRELNDPGPVRDFFLGLRCISEELVVAGLQGGMPIGVSASDEREDAHRGVREVLDKSTQQMGILIQDMYEGGLDGRVCGELLAAGHTIVAAWRVVRTRNSVVVIDGVEVREFKGLEVEWGKLGVAMSEVDEVENEAMEYIAPDTIFGKSEEQTIMARLDGTDILVITGGPDVRKAPEPFLFSLPDNKDKYTAEPKVVRDWNEARCKDDSGMPEMAMKSKLLHNIEEIAKLNNEMRDIIQKSIDDFDIVSLTLALGLELNLDKRDTQDRIKNFNSAFVNRLLKKELAQAWEEDMQSPSVSAEKLGDMINEMKGYMEEVRELSGLLQRELSEKDTQENKIGVLEAKVFSEKFMEKLLNKLHEKMWREIRKNGQNSCELSARDELFAEDDVVGQQGGWGCRLT